MTNVADSDDAVAKVMNAFADECASPSVADGVLTILRKAHRAFAPIMRRELKGRAGREALRKGAARCLAASMREPLDAVQLAIARLDPRLPGAPLVHPVRSALRRSGFEWDNGRHFEELLKILHFFALQVCARRIVEAVARASGSAIDGVRLVQEAFPIAFPTHPPGLQGAVKSLGHLVSSLPGLVDEIDAKLGDRGKKSTELAQYDGTGTAGQAVRDAFAGALPDGFEALIGRRELKARDRAEAHFGPRVDHAIDYARDATRRRLRLRGTAERKDAERAKREAEHVARAQERGAQVLAADEASALEVAPAAEASPDAALEAQEELATLRAELERLLEEAPEKVKAALAIAAGRAQRDAGRELGVDHKTAGAWYREVVSKLRFRMGLEEI